MELFPALFLVGFAVTPLVDLFILLEGLILFPSLNEDFLQSTIYFYLALPGLLCVEVSIPLSLFSLLPSREEIGRSREKGDKRDRGAGRGHPKGEGIQ